MTLQDLAATLEQAQNQLAQLTQLLQSQTPLRDWLWCGKPPEELSKAGAEEALKYLNSAGIEHGMTAEERVKIRERLERRLQCLAPSAKRHIVLLFNGPRAVKTSLNVMQMSSTGTVNFMDRTIYWDDLLISLMTVDEYSKGLGLEVSAVLEVSNLLDVPDSKWLCRVRQR